MQTIADAAGLSKYAVSRALAGKSGVSESTRARVTQLAAQLQYRRPSPAEDAPIAVAFDDTDSINGELYMRMQAGMQQEAARLGRGLRFQWVRRGEDLSPLARLSAGLIVVGRHDHRTMERLYAMKAPVVRTGAIEPLEPVDHVSIADREAGEAVGRRLLALGHRRIAFVHGDPRHRGRMERLMGLREALMDTPSATAHDIAWVGDAPFGPLLDAVIENDEMPTAFFCAHDGLAVTVISELLTRGLSIPRDASVIGFGDFVAAQQITPRLTTIRAPGRRLGAMAVRVLHARIEAPDDPHVRVRVPPALLERESHSTARATTPRTSLTDRVHASDPTTGHWSGSR
ncbi:LacI family DNA-binding transcriptional regulator [Rubrimonas sp.]|uniref:LacI family DNA-binding transcriptional regulator n=1 Tax=Rubrimonas sp. TaxID=2036015 RepID=UPI002FDCB821